MIRACFCYRFAFIIEFGVKQFVMVALSDTLIKTLTYSDQNVFVETRIKGY